MSLKLTKRQMDFLGVQVKLVESRQSGFTGKPLTTKDGAKMVRSLGWKCKDGTAFNATISDLAGKYPELGIVRLGRGGGESIEVDATSIASMFKSASTKSTKSEDKPSK